MAISNWFGGEEKELLPKDVLVDLESNPNRVDEMLAKFIKGDEPVDFSAGVTASAFAFQMGADPLARALRDMEQQSMESIRRQQMAAMQNQGIGGSNGFSNQGLGNALGGFGGLLGPQR